MQKKINFGNKTKKISTYLIIQQKNVLKNKKKTQKKSQKKKH